MSSSLKRIPTGRRVPRVGLFAGILWLAAMAVLLAPAQAGEIPRVVVGSKPLHSLVSGLMRGIAAPTLLIDTQVPMAFRPDEAQQAALAAADLVIWSGAELEPGLAAVVATLPPQRVFTALDFEGLKILPDRGDASGRDPFYWLDSRNMLILLDALGRLLVETDPGRASAYERNWREMGEALSEVDRALEFGYRDVSGVPVFFYHDTHQYFAQAYAMHVAGTVLGGADQVEDTAQLLRTRSRILEVGPSCFFTEKGLSEPNLALLVGGAETSTVELDSFGVGLPPGPDLYVRLMRENFAAISACVRSIRPAEPDKEALPSIANSPDRLSPRYLMMDQYGRAVSNEDFPGQLQLIYFGYTFCPDICPTSLAVMTQALRQLGTDAERVQPIFITVDPQRDSPAVLRDYLAYFDPRLLGLSASPEATRRIAELFRVRYERVEADDGNPQRYAMDHTASLFLLGRRGEFITKFAHGLPADEVATRLREYLAE